jgi:hypothetical protein
MASKELDYCDEIVSKQKTGSKMVSSLPTGCAVPILTIAIWEGLAELYINFILSPARGIVIRDVKIYTAADKSTSTDGVTFRITITTGYRLMVAPASLIEINSEVTSNPVRPTT